MRSVCFAVLAGGSGERLWPLSKKSLPKQMVPFIGGKTLLEQTIDRITPIVSQQDTIWIVTTDEQHERISLHIGSRVDHMVLETVPRNTGPALLLAAFTLVQKNPDSIMVALPSDHFIPDTVLFNSTLLQAIHYVEKNDKIALLGLKPLYPATGYGYIQMGLAVGEGAYVVDSFHEKPDQARAGLYFKDNKMLWNIGIFVGRAQTFLKEYQTCAPELYKTVTECVNHRAVYAQAAHISIDYAVIEKSSHITVFPASFEWHDVGNLYSFLSLMAQYTEKTNEVVNINGAGNLASTQKKLVACIGVSDLCLVETDDVLLVVHRGRVEEVKKLLVSLRQTHEHML